MKEDQPELGDRVEQALKVVGISKEWVEEFLGRPCHCTERQEKLNQLDRWARRTLNKSTAKAYEYLARMVGRNDT